MPEVRPNRIVSHEAEGGGDTAPTPRSIHHVTMCNCADIPVYSTAKARSGQAATPVTRKAREHAGLPATALPIQPCGAP